MRIIVERSVLLEVEESFDLKILHTSLDDFVKNDGNGILVIYGEKIFFGIRLTFC